MTPSFGVTFLFSLIVLIASSYGLVEKQVVLSNDEIAKMVLSAMNQSASPCNDWYDYVCGGWIEANPLPPTESSVFRSFSTIADNNNKVLEQILTDEDYPRLYEFNSACMDQKAINARGLAPVKPYLSQAALPSGATLQDFFEAGGKLAGQGIPSVFWSFFGMIDPFDPTVNAASLFVGGTSLPYPPLYSQADTAEAYKQYMADLFVLADVVEGGQEEAERWAEAAFRFESNVAAFTPLPEDLTDPFKTNNEMSLGDIAKLAPQLPLQAYLNGVRSSTALTSNISVVNVQWPDWLQSYSALLESQDFSDAYTPYLTFKVLDSTANLLNESFVALHFDFWGKTLQGQLEPTPRSDVCIALADATLGELLGEHYLDVAWSAQSQNESLYLINNIRKAYLDDVAQVSWMDNTTRSKAIEKLSLIQNMIGGPSDPDQYLSIKISDDHFSNVMQGRAYQANNNVKEIGKKSDRTAWEMSADTVNAYYEPLTNSMVFPAGIQQVPYFSSAFPPSLIAGGIGMIMGHEMGHSIDNQGSAYNGVGELSDWWTKETRASFEKRLDCVRQQYSNFEVLPGVYANGIIEIGENTADMGGSKMAMHALMSVLGDQINAPSIVPGFNNLQLYFIGYAQGWCANQTPESLEQSINTDPHAPPLARAVLPLANLPQFAEAFQCPVGSQMNPKSRCEVW